jgi:hypothetical protein
MAAEPSWHKAHAAAAVAIVGASLAYALVDWGQWPRLTYDPYRGTWSWPSGPTATVPINYFGGLVWGAAGGMVGAALGLVIARTAWSRTTAARTLLGAWAATAATLAGCYYWWNLWPF